MRRRSHRPWLALAAGAVLTLAACGSDDGGAGGSTGAFCDEMASLAASGDDTSDAENLAALQSVADAAPSEISDEMDQLVDAFEKLQSFDPEAASEEEMADFMALASDLDEPSARIEEYAKENCPDLPDDFFGSG
jgi:hypothetical protein